MKKRGLKRILTFISLGVIMLLSGLFFASCGPDPLSKISLSSSVEGDVLDLKVGESQDITFTINNYDKSIDPTLSFTLSDATSSQSKPNGSNQSVHVQLEQVEQKGASTTVKVTALSGGTTTLVAKSAGDRSAYVTINVQGFASSLTLKQGAELYVTQKTDFVPSANLFEEFIEEERLSFYYVNDPQNAAPENQIMRVSLNDGNLTFTGLNGVTLPSVTAYEGQDVTIYAIYDNETSDKIIKAITFYVVNGFDDGESQIKITDTSGNPLTQVLIIDNGEDETKQTIRITVPTAKFGGTDNEYIFFDRQIESEFIGSETRAQEGENEITYEITLSSRATSAVTTSLKLDLYYKFSGFDGKLIDGDPSLHQVLELPIFVKVAPSSITVNSISAESPDNKYDLYNKYSNQEKYSNYGWHKLELKINRIGSEFDCVHMTFNSDVVVRYQGQIVEGGSLDIKNLSATLEIRGQIDAEPFEEYKKIKFVVESSLLKPDKEISYELNYRILKGSSPLTFTDDAYYYTLESPSSAQLNNGIFMSVSGGEQIFYGLQTDSQQYKVVSINLRDGENVALLAAGEQFNSTEYPNSLPIKITPLKVGAGIYELVLENGQNAILAIKVIETLEDVSVDLFGTNTKVQRMDRLSHGDEYTDAIKLIIKNDEEGSRVNLKAFSSGKVLESITSNMLSGESENSTIEISIGEGGEFAITARGAGTSSFEIVAHGPAVKDFKQDGEATKKARIEVTNYTPISSFKLYQDSSLTMPARRIEKYIGDVTNASLQIAHIYSQVLPSSAYGFYDPRIDDMVDGMFNKDYIYFMITTPGHEAYMASDLNTTINNMTMGNLYYIGYADHSLTNYLGLLDLRNSNDITFTFNPNRKEKASISFFAGIRQYESNLYFPIEIVGQEYLPVSRIYTNLQPDSPIIFEPGNEEADFTVFLSPKEATELALDNSCFSYISDGEGRDIIDVNQLEITEKAKGIYVVHARLNKAGDGAFASGTLTICPKSIKSISVSVRFEYADGNANPYVITSAEQFIQKLKANPNANFLLRSNINLSPYSMPLLDSFSGTIRGENNAQIVGVNISASSSDKQNYGIFGTFSGKISNIGISGEINVDLLSSDNLNIGLLCGVMEGVANNISISLQASNVSIGSGNVGALAGTIAEGGILINTNVIFSSFMQVLATSDVYVGGIAGENNGNIYCLSDGNVKHGYSAYTAYALIDVRSNGPFGEMSGINLAGNAASIFAKGSGNIGFAQDDAATQSSLKTALGLDGESANLTPSKIICGGEIFASNAGGVICNTSGKLVNIVTRTKVRGKTVGLVGTNISRNTNNQNVSVEATENGESVGLAASMGVLFSDISTFSTLGDSQKQNYALFNSEETILTVDPIVSYAKQAREHIGYNSTETASNKNYYGDYIVVAQDGSPLENGSAPFTKEEISLVFQARSSDFSLAAKLGELTTSDANAPRVFYAYYFAVKGYMDGDEYKEYDHDQEQKEISALNTVSMDSPFYPFTISNDDVTISSLSGNIKIDPDGTITFLGEGLAKMQISSLLNSKNEEFYIYVINYFDSTNKSIFTSGELPLGTNTQINSFAKSSAFVSLNPTYNLKLNGFTCSQDGVITLDNGKLIYLQPNKSLKIRATTSDGVADNFGSLKYTNGQVSFIKKPNATTITHNSMSTLYDLEAYLEVEIDGHTYTHVFENLSLDDVKVNYYEGATDVKSNKSNYVVYPSIGTADEWEIVSDLSTDGISKIEFYNARGKKVEGFECACQITNLSGKMSLSLKPGANLEYGDYEMRVFTTSSGDTAVKSFQISLLREELSISMVNYPSLSSFIDKGESDKIEIGLTGLFSITFMPLSDNFDYFEISNNAANSLTGSSMGSFEIGKLQVSDSGYQFVAFNDIQNINGKLHVTKEVLNKNAEGGRFDGQVFVRYLFASQTAGNTAVSGNRVTIDVFIHEPDDESQNVTESFTYTLAKSNLVSISISGDPNKTQIAKGVKYALDVTAQGFENVEVSSTSTYVEISQENGRYCLLVPNEKEIAYPSNGGYQVRIDLKATRTNAFGEKEEVPTFTDLEILEYVINTYDQNANIVKGVNNKVLSTAIGEMVPLELDLERYVEASSQNMPLAREFISQLRAQGEWRLYTDLNANNEDGIELGTAPTTMSSLGQNVKIKTPYLLLDGFNLTTLKSNDVTSTQIRDNHYYFTFNAKSKIEKGVYKFDQNGDRSFSDLFFVDASRRGSIESPNPIYTYEDFVKMERDKYYIQLADIVVPSNFAFPEQIAGGGVEYGEVAYFDGNGKEFILNSPNENGIYDLGTQTSAGLFSRISNSSLIKNVTIRLGDTSNNNVVFSTTAQSLSFGLLAGENNGIVTNVRVYNTAGGEMTLNLANGVQPATATYYFAGIVGSNNGYLTHCTSEIKARSYANLAGIASRNYGTIASSKFINGRLDCLFSSTSLEDAGVGGLVVVNEENGKILTSYTSGAINRALPYSDDTSSSYIKSGVSAGGFAYINNGTISDSYASMPMISGLCSGFVYYNNGSITRCFSTSNITNPNTYKSYYFAGNSDGLFDDCFYLKGATATDPNYSLAPIEFVGQEGEVSPIIYTKGPSNQFTYENITNMFSTYAFSTTPSYDHVWFYANGSQQAAMFNGRQFASGRLELVSANIDASSQKKLYSSEMDENGEPNYVYETESGSNADGSEYNPYIIFSAETMEDYLYSSNGISDRNYRIVCDIDYSSVRTTNLYQMAFSGRLEGNGATISDIEISSSEVLSGGGLFREISGNANKYSIVMNLTFQPRSVYFTHANVVGTLCGTLSYANLYNVSVNGMQSGNAQQTQTISATGLNIVGGVIGLAKNVYELKNITVNIGAVATNISNIAIEQTYSSGSNEEIEKLSYAGGVAGYLAGSGVVDTLNVATMATSIVSGKAGFAFGGIGESATVKKTILQIDALSRIKSYKYGGFVTGELSGTLDDVKVYGPEQGGGDNYISELDSLPATFAIEPYIADAVGGIAGVAQGVRAQINMAYMGHSFKIEGAKQAFVQINTIDYVGGMVGEVKNSLTITKSIMDGNICAKNVLGGVVGGLNKGSSLTLGEVKVDHVKLLVDEQNISPINGGIVGQVQPACYVNITDSYSNAEIDIETFGYSSNIIVQASDMIAAIVSAADAPNSVINLTNVFTTSIFNLKIEDATSTDQTQKVSRYHYTQGNDVIYQDFGVLDGGTSYGGTQDVKSQMGKVDDYKIIEYKFSENIGGTVTTNNTFNLSLKGYNKDTLNKGFTTLYARKHNSNIIITQSEFGKSLNDVQIKVGENLVPIASETLTPEEAIKALMKYLADPDGNGKTDDCLLKGDVWSMAETEVGETKEYAFKLAFENNLKK